MMKKSEKMKKIGNKKNEKKFFSFQKEKNISEERWRILVH